MAGVVGKRVRDEPVAGAPALHKRRNDGASQSVSSGSGDYDDETGHLSIREGELIAGVYRYVTEGGKGTFGKVLMCEDRSLPAGVGAAERLVGIKVVRKIRKYSESARIEADLLADIARADPAGVSGCVRAFKSFEWQEHVCIVFEPLGMSLFDYVKANSFRPLPLYCVQSFADQITCAVAFLHAMGLVHTDLKLENVLLVSRAKLVTTTKETSARSGSWSYAPQSEDIKLIDFGGATYDHETKSSLINTRQYRSPEVILGMEWSLPSDVWSVGCMLMELYTGNLLFQTVRGRARARPTRALRPPLTRSSHARPARSTTTPNTSRSLTRSSAAFRSVFCARTRRPRCVATLARPGAPTSPRTRRARRRSRRCARPSG